LLEQRLQLRARHHQWRGLPGLLGCVGSVEGVPGSAAVRGVSVRADEGEGAPVVNSAKHDIGVSIDDYLADPRLILRLAERFGPIRVIDRDTGNVFYVSVPGWSKEQPDHE
jgi:hypothetical protein